ncbi:MAG: hypothetical protein QXK37_03230 [Candidatus Woesearchaeota archaeon]
MKTLTIVEPLYTKAVSVGECKLNCLFCKGHFIRDMPSIKQITKLKKNEKESYLISGGFTKNGKLPLDFKLLSSISKRKKINLHSGLVSLDEAFEISKYADVVSFNFVTDDKIIKRFYKLNKTEMDFIFSYLYLKRFNKVVPHVIIGLGNELRSLKILKMLGEKRVVFLVLTKSRGIKVREPTLSKIEEVLKFARKNFRHITLGCIRPFKRKKLIDKIAIKYVDTIVFLHPSVDLSGYKIKRKYECCAL